MAPIQSYQSIFNGTIFPGWLANLACWMTTVCRHYRHSGRDCELTVLTAQGTTTTRPAKTFTCELLGRLVESRTVADWGIVHWLFTVDFSKYATRSSFWSVDNWSAWHFASFSKPCLSIHLTPGKVLPLSGSVGMFRSDDPHFWDFFYPIGS